jgi:hypothetical protein
MLPSRPFAPPVDTEGGPAGFNPESMGEAGELRLVDWTGWPEKP